MQAGMDSVDMLLRASATVNAAIPMTVGPGMPALGRAMPAKDMLLTLVEVLAEEKDLVDWKRHLLMSYIQ